MSQGKYYVYTLAYPDGTVFYVGKGSKSRIENHEADAWCIGNPQRYGTRKSEVIRQIKRSGGSVVKQKVAFFEDENEAYVYERQLIASLQNTGYLVNVQHYGATHKEPLHQIIHLSQEAKCALARITQKQQRPHLTEEQVLARLIHDAWHEIDQGYQQAAQVVMEAEECPR